MAWAALVLALLVLPPALSAGQDPGTADPAATPPAPAPPAPPADPAQGQGGQQGASGGGAEPSGGGQPAAVQPTVTAAPATEVSSAESKQDARLAKAASSLTVSIGDNFYSPASISIDAGDTVTWTNDGAAQHSATASDGSFDTGIFGPGGSRSVTFDNSGTFNYFCTVHGTAQSGTVTVASASGGGGGGNSEADAVASSGAAGSSTALPSTGSDVIPPMAVGLLLLAAGLALRLRNWFGPA